MEDLHIDPICLGIQVEEVALLVTGGQACLAEVVLLFGSLIPPGVALQYRPKLDLM